MEAVRFFARHEGVVFALESAHGGYQAMELARSLPRDAAVVVNMSGRGDKDLFITARELTPRAWHEYLVSEAEEIERTMATTVGLTGEAGGTV